MQIKQILLVDDDEDELHMLIAISGFALIAAEETFP